MFYVYNFFFFKVERESDGIELLLQVYYNKD